MAARLIEQCLEIGRMLGGMIEKAGVFCDTHPHQTRETAEEYLADFIGDE